MSGLDLWNSDKEPDKAERLYMSRLGADMSDQSLWKPA
jgi:hypothetical protein